VLSRVLWQRVLLDEAHQDRGAAATMAELHARAKWCLTGARAVAPGPARHHNATEAQCRL
jgi:hypothetical protein